MTARYLVYALSDPLTHEVRYVGQSARGITRAREHGAAHRLRHDTNHAKSDWIRSLQARGAAFEITVLFVSPDYDGLDAAERWWIAYGRAMCWPLFNRTSGGHGFRHTPETRAKIAAAGRRYVCTPESAAKISAAHRGRTQTPEHRKKAADARRGLVRSPETRALLAERSRGHAHSPETRAKLSAALTGRSPTPETREKLRQAGYGRVLTPGERAKISASMQNLSPETRAKLAACARKRWDEWRAARGRPTPVRGSS